MPFLLLLLHSRKNAEGDSLGFFCPTGHFVLQLFPKDRMGWLPLALFKFTKGTYFQILFMSDVPVRLAQLSLLDCLR